MQARQQSPRVESTAPKRRTHEDFLALDVVDDLVETDYVVVPEALHDSNLALELVVDIAEKLHLAGARLLARELPGLLAPALLLGPPQRLVPRVASDDLDRLPGEG